MIATHNQQAPKESLSASLHADTGSHHAINKVQNLDTSSALSLTSRIIAHHPKAGLNPLADTAGYLFSVLGKLRYVKVFRQLGKLQKELIQEITVFQETIKKRGYNTEHIVVCRYILCATFDDIIANTTWGGHGQWESFCLLTAFGQDTQHQDKFFTILERAIKDPMQYIDLMELMYLCLSMGYKGQYRGTEHSQCQLEQITNNLYKHIRAFRGNIGRTLSPAPARLSITAASTTQSQISFLFIFFVTACINTIIFVSLGYLMDVISNEAYKNISGIQTPALNVADE